MNPKNLVTRDQLVGGSAAVLYRRAQVEKTDINTDERVVTLAFSSEYEVERYDWVEILGHGPGECDLGRLIDGGAYLCDHNWSDQRGVILEAWTENNRNFAKVKISRNPLGEQLLVDMQDGIRTHVSVGYRIHEAVLEKRENGKEYYRITKWTPLEISSVSVPADPTVGLGRSDDSPNSVTIREANAMKNGEQPNAPAASDKDALRSDSPDFNNPAPAAPKPAPQQRKEDPVNHAQRIAETAEQYGAVELGNKFIREGKTYESFRDELTNDLHQKRKDPVAESTIIDLDLPTADLKRYSIVNALRAAVTGNWKSAGLERQVSDAIAERHGKDAGGVYLSYEAMGYGLRKQLERQMMLRTQSAGAATLGAELVATDLHSELFIEVLRARAVVAGLGARFLTGLVGNVDIPKQTGSATFYWVAEDGEPTDTDILFSTVQMSPKTIATAVPITRRLMIQSTPDIETLVRDDIMRGLSLGLDNALLKGSGAANQPTGIINTAGIGAVDISGGVNWAKIVELETDVAEANADAATMAYLMRPAMRGTLKTTEKATGTAQFLWGEGGMVNGYNAAVTTEMIAGDILFGDFSQAMVGLWGALDVVPDRATKVASGGLVMRMFQDADVAIRHSQAFSYADNGV